MSTLLEKSSLQIEALPIKGYERVLKVTHKESKLLAIIAIHNTVLGPALGGIRIYPYKNFDEALNDVLRLSMGMTYKSAIAGVGYGGGKSVIICAPSQKTPALLLAFAEAVDSLKGDYICAEDVGSTEEDMLIIRKKTRYVTGLSHEKSSGNPSRFTAWGVYRGIQSVMKQLFGSDSVEGKKIAIQGLGHVGSSLLDFLFWGGAELIIADVDRKKIDRAKEYRAKVVSPEEIFKEECDVLSPCALGGIINDDTLRLFRCKAIAGAANNQLLTEEHGDALREKKILYAPDFVINAGGLLNVAQEMEREGYIPSKPRSKAHRIYDNLSAIFEIANKNGISTNKAAIALAEYRLRYKVGKRLENPYFHHS